MSNSLMCKHSICKRFMCGGPMCGHPMTERLVCDRPMCDHPMCERPDTLPKVLQYLFFHQELSSLASYSSAHPIKDLFPCEKLSHWFCSTIPQGLLYPSLFYRYLYPISSDQFRKHLKTCLFVSDDTDPGREHL